MNKTVVSTNGESVAYQLEYDELQNLIFLTVNQNQRMKFHATMEELRENIVNRDVFFGDHVLISLYYLLHDEKRELVCAKELVAEIETAYTGRDIVHDISIIDEFATEDWLEISLKEQIEVIANGIREKFNDAC